MATKRLWDFFEDGSWEVSRNADRLTVRELTADADPRLKWLSILGGSITAVFTTLDQLKILEPAGVGAFSYAVAALCGVLAVAAFLTAWTRPASARDSIDWKAKGTRWGVGFSLSALLCVGLTPFLSIAWPEIGSGFQGSRVALGYEAIAGHRDSLVISASGRIDPTSSLVLTLSDAINGSDPDAANLRCGGSVIARWGVDPSANGEVTYRHRTAIGRTGRSLCLVAETSEHGTGSEVTRLIIPGTSPQVPTIVLGYQEIPGRADSLMILASGQVDPSMTLILLLTNAVGHPTAACGDSVIARWGVLPSPQGEVDHMGRTAIPGGAGRSVCLLARAYKDGSSSDVTHLIVPGISLPDP